MPRHALWVIQIYCFHRYWDLSTKIIVNKISTDSTRSQSGARTTTFHREKISFVQSATRTTKFHSWWMKVLMEMSSESHCTKPVRIEKWPRFASVCSVEEFILEHENKNTAQKTERDVRLLERFLKTKDEEVISISHLNTHQRSTKVVWYAVEAYQKVQSGIYYNSIIFVFIL